MQGGRDIIMSRFIDRFLSMGHMYSTVSGIIDRLYIDHSIGL